MIMNVFSHIKTILLSNNILCAIKDDKNEILILKRYFFFVKVWKIWLKLWNSLKLLAWIYFSLWMPYVQYTLSEETKIYQTNKYLSLSRSFKSEMWFNLVWLTVKVFQRSKKNKVTKVWDLNLQQIFW